MISIVMALRGLGVWAMVGQQISYYISLMIVLFLTVSWKAGASFLPSTGSDDVCVWLEASLRFPSGHGI